METPYYSSFWPLITFFLFFGGWVALETFDMNTQRVNVEANIVDITPQTQGAANARQEMIELAQDIAQSAAHNNKNAQQIVTEFNIQLIQTPSPTPTK